MSNQYVSRRGVLRTVVPGAVGTGIASESLAKQPDRKIVGLRADGDYITVAWDAIDLNGNLAEVITIVEDSEKTSPASGEQNGNSHVHGPFNNPYGYSVYLTVTDEAGNETTEYTSV